MVSDSGYGFEIKKRQLVWTLRTDNRLSLANSWLMWGHVRSLPLEEENHIWQEKKELLLLKRQAQGNLKVQDSQNFLSPVKWPHSSSPIPLSNAYPKLYIKDRVRLCIQFSCDSGTDQLRCGAGVFVVVALFYFCSAV